MEHGERFLLAGRVEVGLAALRGHSQKVLFGGDPAGTTDALSHRIAEALLLNVYRQGTASAMRDLLTGVRIAHVVALDDFDYEVGHLLAPAVNAAGRTHRVDLPGRDSLLCNGNLLGNVLAVPDVDAF
jgi:hypothetical protein